MPDPLATSHRLPQIADRQTWQAKIDELRVKEKAHTRDGRRDSPPSDVGCRWSRSIRRLR